MLYLKHRLLKKINNFFPGKQILAASQETKKIFNFKKKPDICLADITFLKSSAYAKILPHRFLYFHSAIHDRANAKYHCFWLH